ncbi:MAG: hypothetical protein RMJ98_06450 [Myxococcales bacterium]|nr:hypothetical protein [Polyangiaceae bacterium]MDW8248925.1 hypothetical protein [Myxococcales bacterium]
MASIDLERLLQDLAATQAAVRIHGEELRQDPEHAGNPYEARRWVSGLSTFQALDPGDPAWPYLASWVLWFLLGRTSHEEERREALARTRPSVQVTTPSPEEISWRQGVSRLVRATSEGERVTLAQALEVAAGPIHGASRELWMRRGEVLRRAGGDSLAPLLQPMPTWASLLAEANALLEATEDLARDTLGRPRNWTEALAQGVGQQGDVPWPRRLSPRWLLAPFEGEARWLEVPGLRLGVLPEVAGGSSVTRAMAHLGARWADAAAPRHLPPPLGTLPSALARTRSGALLASLLLTRTFLRKGLGLSDAEATRARRQQARVVLVAVRLEAARVLLLRPALQGEGAQVRQEAEALTHRALGAPIPAALALAFPQLHPTGPARLLSFSLAAADAFRLRNEHDEDWYRNPRAVLALRDRLDRAPDPTLREVETAQARKALVTALLEALG